MALAADIRVAELAAAAVWHLGLYYASMPLCGRSRLRALALLQRWAHRSCRLLRIETQVHGHPHAGPCVYVSNHRSYLDIPLLAAVLGVGFLSRADVAAWPLVGRAARAIGSVFVDRDDVHVRARAALTLARRSESIVVFPEGTTRGDRLPGDFSPGLFRLLRHIDMPLIPITIRYSDRRVYWDDDSTLAQHLRTRALEGPPVTAAVHIGEPMPAAYRCDATAVVRAVSKAIEEFGELTSAPFGRPCTLLRLW
jgi:1-acyl-sn-glycerol-3-phosphate acyltransferase